MPEGSGWVRPPTIEPPLFQVIKIIDKREPNEAMTKLKEARNKVRDLADVVRTEVFDDWIERFVVSVQRPEEWTQSRSLYENYVHIASGFGSNRPEKNLARLEIASETQWGRMMGAVFPTKKRRRSGWYYPVRLKKLR